MKTNISKEMIDKNVHCLLPGHSSSKFVLCKDGRYYCEECLRREYDKSRYYRCSRGR